MLSSLTYLLLLITVTSGDVFADVNDYLKPAKVKSKVLADIGRTLVENEITDHEDKWEELVPVDSLMFRYIWQMARPLEMATSALCPECKEIVASTQKFIVDYPETLIALIITLRRLVAARDL
uniref:Secreted protein n=1 Tax=Bursaphelenchus xylophilus TaxID=6326 RepID=A0A1I7SHV2_BURXY